MVIIMVTITYPLTLVYHLSYLSTECFQISYVHCFYLSHAQVGISVLSNESNKNVGPDLDPNCLTR